MLSIVVPCFNEFEALPQLKQQLVPVVEELRAQQAVEIIFVDDGSQDETCARLAALFTDAHYRIVRHEKNKGLGAALATGAREAGGMWVAYLDCDCTYPASLLIPLLAEVHSGADVATVSPYHPDGRVEGVSPRRQVLSMGLSRLYRFFLSSPVYTYTAMVRVYRRDVLLNVLSPLTGFPHVADTLLRAIRLGYAVSEVPACLTQRQFGESKMKLWPVICGHLRLLSGLSRKVA